MTRHWRCWPTGWRHAAPLAGKSRLNRLKLGGPEKMGCQRPLRRQERRLSPRTRRHIHRILSAALIRAVEQFIGHTPRDAFMKPLPKVECHEMATLTPEQSAHLLHAVRHSHIYWPVPVGLATRARRGEALATPWRNVDRDRGTIRIAIAARPGLVKTPVEASKQRAEQRGNCRTRVMHIG